jgi:transcriptional regulator NrdR family protein
MSRQSDAERKAEAIRGIRCPRCGCAHFRVIYTRRTIGGRIVRRRECRHCGRRVTTSERIV